jgi:hypothetical protein
MILVFMAKLLLTMTINARSWINVHFCAVDPSAQSHCCLVVPAPRRVRPAFSFTAGDKILDRLPEHLHPVDPHVEFSDVLNRQPADLTRKVVLVSQDAKIQDLPDGQAILAAKMNEAQSVHVIRVVRR